MNYCQNQCMPYKMCPCFQEYIHISCWKNLFSIKSLCISISYFKVRWIYQKVRKQSNLFFVMAFLTVKFIYTILRGLLPSTFIVVFLVFIFIWLQDRYLYYSRLFLNAFLWGIFHYFFISFPMITLKFFLFLSSLLFFDKTQFE